MLFSKLVHMLLFTVTDVTKWSPILVLNKFIADLTAETVFFFAPIFVVIVAVMDMNVKIVMFPYYHWPKNY